MYVHSTHYSFIHGCDMREKISREIIYTAYETRDEVNILYYI